MGDVIKVMIVDDHPLIRMAVRAVLTEAGMTVVGECADGTQAVQTAAAAAPDVVIMDVEMPGRSGIQATGDLLARWPTIRVLIVTASVGPRTLQQAAAAGAAGYVVKTGDAQHAGQRRPNGRRRWNRVAPRRAVALITHGGRCSR